jgi:hypothetical protein
MSLCRLRHNVRIVPRERGMPSRIERLGRHGKRCDTGSRGKRLAEGGIRA